MLSKCFHKNICENAPLLIRIVMLTTFFVSIHQYQKTTNGSLKVKLVITFLFALLQVSFETADEQP